MFAILKVETNAVGYWREGQGFTDRAEDATPYGTREEAQTRADDLRRAERWRFLVSGATLVVIVA